MTSKAMKALKEQKLLAPQILDSTNSGRQLWLVKVPKYLSQAWENSKDDTVAKITISKGADKNLNIKMKINASVDTSEIPSEYDICLRPLTDQKMAVISKSFVGSPALLMDGHLNRRADARPAAGGADYMRMKKTQIQKACKPDRVVVQISDRVVNYKPVNQHVHNIQAEVQKKKTEGKKLRDDKDIVTEKLLVAFEKHQFYNIKDLATITNQPFSYLKEILREFCVYNTKNPHRNMWELKPEYRHYK